MLLTPNDGKRGQLGRPPAAAGQAFRFLPREVAEMEKTLEDTKGATPSRELVQALADRFSDFPERAGKVFIQSKQVWNWFQNRRHAVKKGAKSSEKQSVPTTPADASVAKRAANASAAVSSGAKGPDPLKMEFEAKSSRDGAWYDVHSFLAYRMVDVGDPEVRVRFAGFGPEEDEWVNVRNSVRQRSLPCEATECIAVLPGDLVLCFQEGSDQALYYDAYIKDVERRRHDVRGCRCRFLVQYEHDKSAEIVPLRKICRRPETDNRLHPSNLQLAGDTSALSAKDLMPFEPKGNLQSTDANLSGDGSSFQVEPGHQLENHPLLTADSNLSSSMGFVGYKDDQIQGIPFELQAPMLG